TGRAVGIEHITNIPEERGAQRALILDERHREQHLETTLDQHVTTEGPRILIIGTGRPPLSIDTALAFPGELIAIRIISLARRTARAEAAVFEATHRVEATGIVMLIERQARGGAIGVAITQARMHAQGVVLGHGHEQLAVVVE